jgi:UDPglucose 6-dehydrogenase|tara:strand:+ start:23792 stop:24604 length:813 start_codon:yes stop_codon:yes gene_type:complete
MRIGIIGKGFVGSAVEHGFSCNPEFKATIRVYDKNPVLSTHSLRETINHSQIIFLSVPTPANPDGSINMQIVENILFEINDCIKNDCIILLRSTVIPGSTQLFSKKFPKLNLVFNPEFLREKNANDDFINQSRVVLGGEKKLTDEVAKLYNWRFQNSVPIIQTNFQTAELIKYMSNCFLATKVSFMNEMKMIASETNVDWDKAVEGFIGDPRVGISHVNVPGSDGRLGFAGSCFPKDLQAIIHFAKSINVDMNVLEGAWETNIKVRPDKD